MSMLNCINNINKNEVANGDFTAVQIAASRVVSVYVGDNLALRCRAKKVFTKGELFNLLDIFGLNREIAKELITCA